MKRIDTARVKIWGQTVGAVYWNEHLRAGEFQYAPDFIRGGLELSPVVMPLSRDVFRFTELSRSETYQGLPGLLADSLPEKFSNTLMKNWLALKGISFLDLNPVERLCYLGSRGMGALEFEPDINPKADELFSLDIPELFQIAREIMSRHDETRLKVKDTARLEHLIQVGTSAGGAKAKVLVALNEQTGEIISGQAKLLPGFEHWLLKLSEVDNSEHLSDRNVGRLEYAYYLMAVRAGISMMESRLMETGKGRIL